jgi:serine/threonine-protein kinase
MPDKDQHPTVVLTKNQFSLPRDFGEYRLTEKLGDSMAMVFKAEQKNPKRRVVVKIPRGGLLLTEESRSRFLREVELAANADHAGIVPVLDAGEIDGTPYYTMPYIEGFPIDQHLQSNCPTLKEKLEIFRQLCEVVGALHKKDLIHRDLKPANVLVDTHGSIRLLDFGLAKVAREVSDISLSPTVMGTLDYMAP